MKIGYFGDFRSFILIKTANFVNMKRAMKYMVLVVLLLSATGMLGACSRAVFYEDGDFDYDDDAQQEMRMLNSEIDNDDQWHE